MDRSEVICEDGTYGTLRGDRGRPETNTVSACKAPGPGGRLGLLGARGPACWLAPLRRRPSATPAGAFLNLKLKRRLWPLC